MSISLQKGQKVSLSKDNAGLSKIIVGLGWDEVQQSSSGGGFLSALFGGGSKQQPIDCDASALMLKNGKLVDKSDIVYFGNLHHKSGTVNHQGDNLTGAGDGDDEQIVIATNQGEPLSGKGSQAEEEYQNICRRLMGEEVPFSDINQKKGFFKRLGNMFRK